MFSFDLIVSSDKTCSVQLTAWSNRSDHILGGRDGEHIQIGRMCAGKKKKKAATQSLELNAAGHILAIVKDSYFNHQSV